MTGTDRVKMSSASSLVPLEANFHASQASHTSIQQIAAPMVNPGKSRGGLWAAQATRSPSTIQIPTMWAVTPRAASHHNPHRAPVVVAATATNMTHREIFPWRSWAGCILVRSTVGHKVMRVPTTVRPTKPSRLSAWWATNRRVRHGSVGEKAMIAPRVAPSGSRHAAAQ